jgi:hypothetical protein
MAPPVVLQTAQLCWCYARYTSCCHLLCETDNPGKSRGGAYKVLYVELVGGAVFICLGVGKPAHALAALAKVCGSHESEPWPLYAVASSQALLQLVHILFTCPHCQRCMLQASCTLRYGTIFVSHTALVSVGPGSWVCFSLAERL